MLLKKVFSIFLFHFICTGFINAQSVQHGVLDLSQSDVLKDTKVDLSGEWQFYYGKHLTAKQMKSIPKESKIYIINPSSWTSIVKNGKPLPSKGIGTYAMTIILKKQDKTFFPQYGLSFGNVVSAYKLWVNDKLIIEVGDAAPTSKGFRPIYFPQTCYTISESDTLNVVVQVSNYYDPLYAGFLQSTYFGTANNILHYQDHKTIFNTLIFGVLLLVFFYQITLSIVQKEEKSHIIIAILSLVSMSKMLCDGPISIYNFIPSLDFYLFLRIWFFSFFIIYIIFRLTRVAYPTEFNKTISSLFNFSYLVLAVIILIADPLFVVKNNAWFVYLNLISILYLFFVFSKAVLKGLDYSIISFISFIIMVLFITNDLLYVVFQSTAGYRTHIGVAIFISIQSVTISMKYARSHKKVVKMSNEILEINRGLEDIVSERTQALENIGKQKDLLISTISHDLMGFFNTMLNLSKVLSCDKTLDGEQKETLQRLYQTSHRGYYLLDNILAWAKLQIKFNPEKELITDLKSLVDRNIELFSEQITCKTISAIVHIDNTLQFKCSNENLNSILRNLISNAIKFSNTGGEIHISNQVKDGLIQIRIHDSGIGISNELMTHLFTSELSMKREGTLGERGSGLGLLIVKELVEGNNGKIYCNSEINKGTCFIVEFTADIAAV